MIIPSKDVITVFTETRQDWAHGDVAGWYDNLSLRPVPEPTKLLYNTIPKGNLPDREYQHQTPENAKKEIKSQYFYASICSRVTVQGMGFWHKQPPESPF